MDRSPCVRRTHVYDLRIMSALKMAVFDSRVKSQIMTESIIKNLIFTVGRETVL